MYPQIALVKVDCTEAGKDTCNKYSVSGYPTLKIFAKTEVVSDYTGPREAAGIAKSMKVYSNHSMIQKLKMETWLKKLYECNMAIFVLFRLKLVQHPNNWTAKNR